MGGPIYDNLSTKDTTSTSGDTISHIGDGGDNRYAVVTLHRSAGSGGIPPVPSTMKYDGVDMTLVADKYSGGGGQHRRSSVYVLAGFNVGTKNIIWTSTYANWYAGTSVITFDNVVGHRTITALGGNGTSGTQSASDLLAKELLIGIVTGVGGWDSAGGQSDYWDRWYDSCVGSYKTGIGSVTLTWSGPTGYWAAGGVVLTGGAGGATAIAMFYKSYQDFMDRLRKGLIPSNQLEKEYGLVMSKAGSI